MSTNRAKSRLTQINAEIGILNSEREEIIAALRVLDRYAGGEDEPRQSSEQNVPSGRMTTKDLLAHVLSTSHEVWLTASEIKEKASAIRGSEVPTGTIAPTLTEMKNSGTIVRDGFRVAIASRCQKNEASAQAEAPINPARDESDTSMSHSGGAFTSQEEKGAPLV